MFDPGCHLFLSKGSKLIRAVCGNETIILSKRQGLAGRATIRKGSQWHHETPGRGGREEAHDNIVLVEVERDHLPSTSPLTEDFVTNI